MRATVLHRVLRDRSHDGRGRFVAAVVALDMTEGRGLHRFRAHTTILATGGYGRTYFSCTSASFIARCDGTPWRFGPGLPCRTWSSCNSIATGIYGTGCLITAKLRLGRRGLPDKAPRASRFAGALCAKRQETLLQRRRREPPRHDDGDPRRPRRWRGSAIISHLRHLHHEHLGPAVIHERLHRYRHETARIFAGVDVTKAPIPVQPTVHYNMGGIRLQLSTVKSYTSAARRTLQLRRCRWTR